MEADPDILDMLLAMLLAGPFILFRYHLTVSNMQVLALMVRRVTCVLSDGRYRPCSHACHVTSRDFMCSMCITKPG